jgi:hypothetical protein
MKRAFQLGGGTLGALVLILLGLRGHATSAQQYSNANLKGTYVFSTSGICQFLLPGQSSSAPTYTVATGILTADGAGHATGTQTTIATPLGATAIGGNAKPGSMTVVCQEQLTSTSTINPDGTGTYTTKYTPITKGQGCEAGTGTGRIVIESADRFLVTASSFFPDDPLGRTILSTVVLGEFRRQH